MDGVGESGAYAWTLTDLILLVGLGLSVVVGAWRGLVTEMLSLAGWGVSYFSAQWFGADMGAMLPVGEPGQRLNVLAGMIVVFVLAWLGWALLSWALTQVVRASPLSAPHSVGWALEQCPECLYVLVGIGIERFRAPQLKRVALLCADIIAT